MKKSPLARVKEQFENKEKLVAAIEKLGTDELWLTEQGGTVRRVRRPALLARALAEPWRPHRGAVAIFTWHCYNNPAL